MIRAATPHDIPALVALGRLMHAESPIYSRLRFDADILARNLKAVMTSPHGFSQVCEIDGELAGGMVAAAVPHWCSPDLVACDLALFIHPEHRGGTAAVRLLTAYRDWAGDTGAVLVQFGVMTGVNVERTQAMCERLGWERQGVVLCA